MRRAHRIVIKTGAGLALWWVVLPVLGLLALRWVWHIEATHRLARARAALIAARPVETPVPAGSKTAAETLAEIWGKDLPDAKDCELLLGAAKTGAIWDRVWTPAEDRQIKSILASRALVFGRIDAVAGRPIRPPPHPVNDADYEAEAERRETLFDMLFQSARLAFDEHREAEALHRLRELELLQGLESGEPDVRAFRGSMMATRALEEFEPRLQLRDANAAREARRLLSQWMTDDFTTQFIRAWIDESSVPENTKFDQEFVGWWYPPLCEDGVARSMEHALHKSAALSMTDYQQAKSYLLRPWYSDSGTKLAFILDLVELDLSDTPWIRVNAWLKTDRAAMAILLAAHIYAADNGRFPANAKDLVPRYLPHIPADPFAANRKVHYRLDPGGPTVWSVGEDGVDGGAKTFLFKTDGTRKYQYFQRDIVYGSAWRNAAPPAAPASRPR